MKRILIVDDDVDISRLLKVGLERRGYRVVVVNDPVEALSDFEAAAYDLLIIDIRMPKMNGFDLFRELRKIDSEVKMCFFTAFEVYLEEFHKSFPELSSDCFLRKPMPIAEFAASIKALIGE